MRAIHLADTPEHLGGEKNQPVLVYDTSGAYTDPDVSIDLQQGLPAVRVAWIDARGDTETLDAQSSAYGRERLANADLDNIRFEHLRLPRRAQAGKNVTQMHYVNQITDKET